MIAAPWGHHEVIWIGEQYQVKRLVVKAGARLSLQSHQFRAETWTVVEGTIIATVGSETRELSSMETVFVPVDTRHRIENAGDVAAIVIEVQHGDLLIETDIVRYDDDYGRS